MARSFEYERSAELPGLTLPWEEQLTATTWANLDLSTGYTFTLRLVDSDNVDVLTKTTNITGADGSVVVAWAVGDLDLTPGTYTLRLSALETGTGKNRTHSPGDPVRIVIV